MCRNGPACFPFDHPFLFPLTGPAVRRGNNNFFKWHKTGYFASENILLPAASNQQKTMNMKRFLSGLALTATLSAMPVSLPPFTSMENFASLAPFAIASENTQNAEQLYTANCQVCHSMRPPAKTAPPIVGLAARYRTVYGNKEDAVKAMVSFMKAPDASNTALGPRAIKRFGLMPAMSMSDGELEKVSGWLWDQYDPNFETRGNCR